MATTAKFIQVAVNVPDDIDDLEYTVTYVKVDDPFVPLSVVIDASTVSDASDLLAGFETGSGETL
jgi:hypothetical protein